MRSRASGGTCGASIAAASAETMSSLRRRAICVHRAMSTERSSIGGRASARTTAPASVGSARRRSHARTSRISARWKNAASPTSRCGIARSSSATLTAWPSWVISGTSTATRPGATASRASRCSMSTATDWAWERSLAQRHSSHSPPGAPASACAKSSRPSIEVAACQIGPGQRWLRSSTTTRVSAPSKLRMRAAPAPR